MSAARYETATEERERGIPRPLCRRLAKRSGPILAALAALAVALAGSSCRSVEGTRGLPPLYEIYDSPSSDEWEGEEGRETVLRPFGSIERIGPESARLKVLYPFMEFLWTPAQIHYRILPIFRYRNRAKLEGGNDVDWMIFPFFFWGSDPDEGGYFAFFPFAGKLRGLLGQDEILFVLFPAYARLYSEGRYSTHVLWPFINTVSGAGWSGGRFWPFYGRYAWDTVEGLPRSRRRFVLWPFYIRATEDMQRDPREVFATYPFYGIRENSRMRTQFFLWPFFVVNYDKKLDNTLVGGYIFPYRFTSYEGKNYEIYQFDPWPLFGWKRTVERLGDFTRRRLRQFAIWPIERYDWMEDPRERTRRFWLLPLYWDYSTIDKLTLETRREWKVWPLAEYRRAGKDIAFDLLSPLWFDREVYRRLYGRLFAIFRYRASADAVAWELLYGTLYWGRGPDEALFSVLGGLLELGRRKDSLVIRILYVPWW